MVKGVSDGSTVALNSADNLLCIYLFQGQIYSLIQEIVILPNISEAFFHWNLWRTDHAKTAFSGIIGTVMWFKINQPEPTDWYLFIKFPGGGGGGGGWGGGGVGGGELHR